MADTQRTRAALLALFADNVTGQISAQDLRDFLVTIMESEFANAGDFWKQPAPEYVATDATAKGWIDYSQVAGSDCSWMNIMVLNQSGLWIRADVADSTKTGVLGLAMDNYTSNDSNMQILRDGVVYFSTWCATWSGNIGRPVYLQSGVPGSVSYTITTNSNLIVGFIEANSQDDEATASARWRFRPEWAIRGQ